MTLNRLQRRLAGASLAVVAMGAMVAFTPTSAAASPMDCSTDVICVSSCNEVPPSFCSSCPAGIGLKCDGPDYITCDGGYKAYCDYMQ